MKKKWLRSVCVAGMAASVVPVAVAQGEEPVGGLEEVVVTARKSAESLQEVPLSITALSAEDMQKRQIRDLADVAALTPGLNYESYLGGNGTPVIRGAAQARIQDLDANVSTFFDGIYLPRTYVVSPGVVGLERVEVVKGPQSALYGRNAFMGAINYVSKKPGENWDGQVEGTFGSDDRLDILAEVAGPIIADKLYGRLGYGRSEFGGEIENSHPLAGEGPSQGTRGNLGGWENQAFQARLVFTPTDTLEFDLGFYRFENFSEHPATARFVASAGDMNCGTLRPDGNRSLYCGEIGYSFRPLPGGGPQGEAVIDPRGYGIDTESNLLRGHVTWEARENLMVIYEYGKLTAESIGGGNSDRDPILGSINPLAPTAPRANQFQISPVGELNYRSNELRVQFQPTESVDLIVGYFDSVLNDFDTFPLNYALPKNSTVPFNVADPGWTILTRGSTNVDARAWFGSASWRIDDRWRVGLEARQADERKTLVSGPTSFSTVVRRISGEWSQFTPRGTVDFKATEKNMLYLTVAKGAKSGGFNLSAIDPSQFEFAPDENWTYEIGSKNELFDGRLRLNGSLFYVDWSNQQVSCSALGAVGTTTPPAVICNLGAAEILGFEGDATWKATERLTFTAGVSYNDATYADGVIDQRIRDFRICDNVACSASGDISGNQLMRQSKVQGQLGLDYEFPVGASLQAFVGGDIGYKSKQYVDSMNLGYLPDRSLGNVRAGLRGENFDVMAWVKNVTDEHYATAAYAIIGADTNFLPIQGQQRTFGVTARYRFGD